MTNLAKLRWQCRRGTRELDLLLTRYLDNRYMAASVEERALFVELLEFEDDYLINMLINNVTRPSVRLLSLVQTIRTLQPTTRPW